MRATEHREFTLTFDRDEIITLMGIVEKIARPPAGVLRPQWNQDEWELIREMDMEINGEQPKGPNVTTV